MKVKTVPVKVRASVAGTCIENTEIVIEFVRPGAHKMEYLFALNISVASGGDKHGHCWATS
jgi:hypothetical protein